MWEFFNRTLVDTDSPWITEYRDIYIPFNYVEASLWLAIALFVLWRYVRHRKTWYELLYAASFVLFGLTDVLETHSTPVWLLGFKGACLLGIVLGRKLVVSYYPGAKL